MTPADEAWAACDRLAERYRPGGDWHGTVRHLIQEACEDFAREWTTRLHDFSIWDDTSTKMLARWIGRYLVAAGFVEAEAQR